MKKQKCIAKKYVFGYDTGYVNGNVMEEVELQIPISIINNEELLNKEIEDCYQEWLSNNVDAYWYEKEE